MSSQDDRSARYVFEVVGDFAFDLVAKATTAADRSEVELASCSAAVSGYMDWLLRNVSFHAPTHDHP